MEASKFLPDGEPQPPQITFLTEYSEGEVPIRHFYLDGQDSRVTITGELDDELNSMSIYRIKFYDWEFGEFDVHEAADRIQIEWWGTPDGLDELAEIQAQKLMKGSWEFLRMAIQANFPKTQIIEDHQGNRL